MQKNEKFKKKTSHITNFKTGSETWFLINDWASPWMVGSNTKASTVQRQLLKRKITKPHTRRTLNPEVKHDVPECHHLFLDFYSTCMVHMNIVLHHVNRKEIYTGYIKV